MRKAALQYNAGSVTAMEFLYIRKGTTWGGSESDVKKLGQDFILTTGT
jgi:hypothetical protein